MIYRWSEFNHIFNKINLDIIDVDIEIHNSKLSKYNGKSKNGINGKTCWYFPLDKDESNNIGINYNNCGLKIIKYPVYYDIIDEYHRLLNEFSIQKILYAHNMAPNIYKIILVKLNKKISFKWLSQKMVFPAGSILFAQIVENIENKGFDNDILVTESGIPYGRAIDSFLEKCNELRIIPYDVNIENLFCAEDGLKVVDMHKWKRSYSVIPPVVPKYVQIELNNTCNAKCKMCNIPSMARCRGLMSDELFLKIIKEAHENGVEYITPFLHGEPFLRKDFIDKLHIINRFAPNAKITIFTNASMLTNRIAEELKGINNIDQLVFSFPGGNKQTYESVTGLDFQNNIHNIKQAFRILSGINMRISMPICEDNKSSIGDFYKLWEGYPCSIYETYNYIGDVSGTLSNICYEQCDRAFRSMTILYDGRICLCCMDSNGKYIMGDISKNSMIETWNSAQYLELRRLHNIARNAYEPCAMCTLDLRTEEYNNVYCNNNSI